MKRVFQSVSNTSNSYEWTYRLRSEQVNSVSYNQFAHGLKHYSGPSVTNPHGWVNNGVIMNEEFYRTRGHSGTGGSLSDRIPPC